MTSSKNSGHTAEWKGAPKYVANCPECGINAINPTVNAQVIRPGQRTAVCRAGHTFDLYRKSRGIGVTVR